VAGTLHAAPFLDEVFKFRSENWIGGTRERMSKKKVTAKIPFLRPEKSACFAPSSRKILYFGNPVALVSSLNEDTTTDLAPISSFWALGWFHYEPRKFEVAELTPMPSDVVKPVQAKECSTHLEARVTAMHKLSGKKLGELGGGFAAETEILRVHVAGDFVVQDKYIDPTKWSPLIYNFRHYFRLADQQLGKTFRAEA
jgi:flavin reductase (DIM6/NTAB) family NADH-FMN oxidoreductase RutF